MRNTIDLVAECAAWQEEVSNLEQICASAVLQTLDISPPHANISSRGINVCVVLADNMFVQTLNAQFRGQDKPTNILSFPNDPEFEELHSEGMIELGDVILAFETIKLEANEQKKQFSNHLKHLLVHGTLHLLGYDHQNDNEAEIMENLEIRILETLHVENPYI
jgi:probable rRNA maturation factor